MRNIFKLVVVHIRLQKISYYYRWIHVVLVTQCIRNKTILKLSLKLSGESSERCYTSRPLPSSKIIKKPTKNTSLTFLGFDM